MSELRLTESGDLSSVTGDSFTGDGFTEAERGDVEALAGLLMKAIDVTGFGKYREPLSGAIAATAEEAGAVPADQITWRHMAAVEVRDGEKSALSAWEEVKQCARNELASGHRAASVMEGSQSSPIERARFLAIREAIILEWQPKGGLELGLIDTLAQAQSSYLHWLSKLTQRTEQEAAEDLRDRQKLYEQQRKSEEEMRREQVFRWGEWIPERISTSEAIAEAMTMVDRWNRVYIRTLRNLRDLRRYNITINNPAQVNFGEKQVNVSSQKNLQDKTPQEKTLSASRPRVKRRAKHPKGENNGRTNSSE